MATRWAKTLAYALVLPIVLIAGWWALGRQRDLLLAAAVEDPGQVPRRLVR